MQKGRTLFYLDVGKHLKKKLSADNMNEEGQVAVAAGREMNTQLEHYY